MKKTTENKIKNMMRNLKDLSAAFIHAHGLIRDLYESEIRIKNEALEEAARLCEKKRCRKWSPEECAFQIRDQLIMPDPLNERKESNA